MVLRPYPVLSPVPVITGHGLVTALGDSATATWASLLAGRYISDHAKVPFESPSGHSRVSSLAIRAAREAVQSADVASLRDAALVVGTSKGPVENWIGEGGAPAESDWGLAGIAS